MESISARVQKELVLLHRKNVGHPSGTVKWLNALGWLSAHFHVSYRSARNVCVGVVLTMRGRGTNYAICASSYHVA